LMGKEDRGKAGLPPELETHTWRSGLRPNGKLGSAPQPRQPPICPECGSFQTCKDGLRRTKYGPVQRWKCHNCGRRFTDPSFYNLKSNLRLKRSRLHSSGRQVCVSLAGAKNLAEVESRREAGLRGATKTATSDLKSLLFNFSWWLKKNNYSPATIRTHVKWLKALIRRGANLRDPESVKDVMAKQKWSPSTRLNVAYAYTKLLEYLGLKWEPPRCKRNYKLPWIPYERELDDLIAGCSRTIGTFLLLLKETAMRAGEAYKLKWENIDFERKTIMLNDPEKYSNPRIFKVSDRLLNMLAYLRRRKRKGSIFGYGSIDNLRRTFERQKRSLAHKLGNPRLKRITFHTFRHWKATMLAHQTKDPFFVKDYLGHKNIMNTMRYIHLSKIIFKEENEEYTCKVARTIDEATKLIEAGFEYVCEIEGASLFRRRK